MTDEELERLAQRLGARAADRLVVEATARVVVERLRVQAQAEARFSIWRQPAWLGVAAVLAVMISGGVLMWSIGHRRPLPMPATTAGAELNDLSTDQLRDVLDALGQPAAEEAVSSQDVSLEELSPPQLRALLRSLEG